MPHLILQYSKNLDNEFCIQVLCENLRLAMIDTGIFPLGGVRVRAFAADYAAIADAHPENAFTDMVLRMGAGRAMDEKKRAGEALLATARRFYQERLEAPHFALSLEILEIDPMLSWKINSIHPRVKQHREL